MPSSLPSLRPGAALPLLALAVASLACHGSSGGGAAPAPLGLGIAASEVLGDGRLLLVRVPEPDQGNRDLNGDGDTSDSVAWAYDLESAQLRNLGLAVAGAPNELDTVADELALFAVSESAQGALDLNGDGDTLDSVAHVYDVRTGVVTNLALALGPVPAVVADDFVAFTVHEAAQGGADLDGDGVSTSDVLHVYDARTGQTKNVERNVTLSLLQHEGLFGFTSDERARGDLNGDGDTDDDFVPHFYEPVQQTLTVLPVALFAHSLTGSEAWIALVSEAGEGEDLDRDGDKDAGVYHRLEPELGTWTSLELSAREPALSSYSTLTAAGRAVLIASESDGIDRDGDGQLVSLRLVIHDLEHDVNFETGLPVGILGGQFALQLAGGMLAVRVNEDLAGEDLDGDGANALDDVIHLVDLTTGVVKNLQVDSGEVWGTASGLLFVRAERDEDLNGDGDLDEFVLQTVPAGTLTALNTKFVASVLDVQGEYALLSAFEDESRQDWNGDGDTFDTLVLRYRIADGATTALAPWSFASFGRTRFGRDGRLVHLASEFALGQDLNADGDELDLALQVGAPIAGGA